MADSPTAPAAKKAAAKAAGDAAQLAAKGKKDSAEEEEEDEVEEDEEEEDAEEGEEEEEGEEGEAGDAAEGSRRPAKSAAAMEDDADEDEEEIPSDYVPEERDVAVPGVRGVCKSWRPWRPAKEHRYATGRKASAGSGDSWQKKQEIKQQRKQVQGLVKEIQQTRVVERQNYQKRLRARQRQKLKFAIQKAEVVNPAKVKKMSKRLLHRARIVARAGLFLPGDHKVFD